jgi:hypothetical protein
LLNLEIEAGDLRIFRTATEGVDAFGHAVELDVLGFKFESKVYFSGDERINKNLLGRAGWLDRIRLGLVDYDGNFIFRLTINRLRLASMHRNWLES